MYSANIGFLFDPLPVAARLRAAAAAGFDAVECHFPYDTPAEEIRAALQETGLPLLGINTVPGDVSAGDFGLCAVPGREQEAHAAIRQAISYGAAIGAANVHVMAGRTDGGTKARETFCANLNLACDLAEPRGMNILIEPINQRDVPGYHLSQVEDGMRIIDALGRDNLKLMFDCYHVQVMQGDLTERLKVAMPVIGHIQIAAAPDRGEPDKGEINYRYLIAAIRELGFSGAIGAEYKPRGISTEEGLGWLAEFRRILG